MKPPIAFSALAVLVIAFSTFPASAEDCLKCRVKGYVGALNSHDMERILPYFGDELRFVAPGVAMTLDRSAVHGMFAWDAATDSAVRYADLEWEGDTVRGVFIETNEFYRLLGIDERSYRITFRFDGKLIREMRLEPADETSPSLDEALAPFLKWASARHADVLAEIHPRGRALYNGETAVQWLRLLEEWRAS